MAAVGEPSGDEYYDVDTIGNTRRNAIMPSTTKKKDERNNELENLVGNLFICLYQTDKIKQRIAETTGGRYARAGSDESVLEFQLKDRKYKIRLSVEQVDTELERVKDELGKKNNDETTNNTKIGSTFATEYEAATEQYWSGH